QSIDFTRDIQPIFKQYCYKCHGPTEPHANLRLDSPDRIRTGGDSGPVIVPGKSAESEIIRRVMAVNADDRMPQEADPLPAATIALLRAWIDQGASMPAPSGPVT